MSVLDRVLGRGDSTGSDAQFRLSKENHDVAYAAAVRRVELDAFDRLVRAEAAASYLEDARDALEEVLPAGTDEEDRFDAQAWEARASRPRRNAETVVERWREQVVDDVGVVYCTKAIHETLLTFVQVCRERSDDEADPFDLPEDFPDALTVVKRIERALDRDANRVLVNSANLPSPE